MFFHDSMDNRNSILCIFILLPPWAFGCSIYYHADCQEIKDTGFTQSGVYHVTSVGAYKGLDVYCDMETDGGGWLVFQRRQDGSVDFYRGWEDYSLGFGNVSGEHWLGNLALYRILNQKHYADNYELRIDFEDWDGNTSFANYKYFNLGSPAELYRLTVHEYSGNAGNSLGPSNGMAFSARDHDNDAASSVCTERYNAAWWYNDCTETNLNGIWFTKAKVDEGYQMDLSQGITWNSWRGQFYSLKRVEMKVRRV